MSTKSAPRPGAADYRSRLNGKHILVLLDDAASGAGLRDLVPPPPAALLITSRTRIALAGVAPIELVRLTRTAAKALLASLVPNLTMRRPIASPSSAPTCHWRCASPARTCRRPPSHPCLSQGACRASPPAHDGERRRHRAAGASSHGGARPQLRPPRRLRSRARPYLHPARVFPAEFDALASAAVLDSDDAARSLALLQRRSLVQQPLPGPTACTTSCVSWRWRRLTRARKMLQAGGIVNTIGRCSPGATRRSRDVAPTTASPSKPSSET